MRLQVIKRPAENVQLPLCVFAWPPLSFKLSDPLALPSNDQLRPGDMVGGAFKLIHENGTIHFWKT